MTNRIYDRPDLDGNAFHPALYVVGTLVDAQVLLPYEGRLQIRNAIGACQAEQISGDELPPGAQIYVDQTTMEVVVAWPAYAENAALLENPGFESGNLGGWNITKIGEQPPKLGIPSVSSSRPRTGSYSALWKGEKGTGHAGGVEAVWQNIARADCYPTKRIDASAYFALDDTGSSQNRGQVRLQFFDGDGAIISERVGTMIRGNNSSYRLSSVSAAGPDGVESVAFAAWTTANDSNNSGVRFDDAVWNAPSIVGTNAPGTYCIQIRVRDSAGRTALWAGCVSVIEDEGGIACGVESSYTGGSSFPTEIEVVLGSQVGVVDLDWLVGAAPDKFVVIWNNQEVINTGFRGYATYYQPGLNTILASHGLPPEPIRPGDVLTPDPSLQGGYSHSGKNTFMKTAASPTKAILRVYGGSSGTQWTCSLRCPDPNAALFILNDLPLPEPGVAYSATVRAVGGRPAYTYAVTGGTLPTGLSLASSGQFSGSAAPGTYSFTVTATDSLGATAAQVFNMVIVPPVYIPLTYEDTDKYSALTLVRQGGPLATPLGGFFNGYNARLKATGLPAWIATAAAPLCIQASVTPSERDIYSSIDRVVIAACTDNAAHNPKMALIERAHGNGSALAVQYYTGATNTRILTRRTWRFEFIYPELVVNGSQARPQATAFIDSNTLLIAAHYENTRTRVHRVNLTTGEITGWFDMPLTHYHIGAIKKSANGSWWAGDYATGDLLRFDLEASLASNVAVIQTTYHMSAVIGFAAIDFVTVGGVEYLLAAEYYASTTNGYLYVIPASVITDGGTFDVAQRYRRYVGMIRMQGVRHYGGALYLSAGIGGIVGGGVRKYAAFDLTLADGANLGTGTETWEAPSQYPEDFDFHPVTGHMWMMTEGDTAVAAPDNFLAMWSSPFNGKSVENTVTMTYQPDPGYLDVMVNSRPCFSLTVALTAVPATLVVGGWPAAAVAWNAGYFDGYVRDIVVQAAQLSPAARLAAYNGDHEARNLTVVPLTLLNPGAETGDITGWTNETGVMTVRQANPDPHAGLYYFYDATSPATLARQRVAIPVSAANIDAGKVYARIEWYQATYTTGGDLSGAGLRFLNSVPAQISQSMADNIALAPTMAWFRRAHSADVPVNARNLDALISMTRVAGTASDGYTDDVAVTLYVK